MPDAGLNERSQVRRHGAFVPGKGFSYLTGDPLGGRIGGRADPDQFPSQMTDDHEAIEQP